MYSSVGTNGCMPNNGNCKSFTLSSSNSFSSYDFGRELTDLDFVDGETYELSFDYKSIITGTPIESINFAVGDHYWSDFIINEQLAGIDGSWHHMSYEFTYDTIPMNEFVFNIVCRSGCTEHQFFIDNFYIKTAPEHGLDYAYINSGNNRLCYQCSNGGGCNHLSPAISNPLFWAWLPAEQNSFKIITVN